MSLCDELAPMPFTFGSAFPAGDDAVGGSLRPPAASSSPSGMPSPSLSATDVLKITAADARQAEGLALAWMVVEAVSPKPFAKSVPGMNWLTVYTGFAHDRSDDGLVCGKGSVLDTIDPLNDTVSV